MTLQEIRENGYKVFVKHHRVFEVNGYPVGVKDGDTVDNILTRGEFENACENLSVYTIEPESGSLFYLGKNDYKHCVSTHGGFTEVELIDPNGQVYKGKYNFNKHPFNRKKGLRAALGRALKS